MMKRLGPDSDRARGLLDFSAVHTFLWTMWNSIWQPVKDAVSSYDRERGPEKQDSAMTDCDLTLECRNRLKQVIVDQLRAMGYKAELCGKRHVMEFNCTGDTVVISGQVDAVITNGKGAIDTVVVIEDSTDRIALKEHDVDKLAIHLMMTNARAGMIVHMRDGQMRTNWFSRDTLKNRWNEIVKAQASLNAYMDIVRNRNTVLKIL